MTDEKWLPKPLKPLVYWWMRAALAVRDGTASLTAGCGPRP